MRKIGSGITSTVDSQFRGKSILRLRLDTAEFKLCAQKRAGKNLADGTRKLETVVPSFKWLANRPGATQNPANSDAACPSGRKSLLSMLVFGGKNSLRADKQ
jgi:hypothetical protein